MSEALEQAKIAFKCDEVPVGCVIVKNNKIIVKSYNMMKSINNPTAHAEIIAIQLMQYDYLSDCDMYVTLEPCHMCAAAISLAKIRRLYIGALDTKAGGIYHNAKLFYQKLNCIPEHYNGFFESECSELLKQFFVNKRRKAIL